ncbi:non-ribosomal peptide synthetase MbtF domain protein [Mycobacterium ulcerans str. Harvey]|uniref:Non-ribosomal peptide synthetase MbtF domain protein n=1 Tax=Mycobacterium ulcerans str. Harvey TaxID=1299332 RepID=A0ABP3ACT1_MYCUL|nr:non-ribosomal peptide synthetase MbtF domain protein [Mycobacterium ulcerans str. Harvey]
MFVGVTAEGTQLIGNWRWSDAVFERSDIDHLTGLWQRGIAALAAGLD